MNVKTLSALKLAARFITQAPVKSITGCPYVFLNKLTKKREKYIFSDNEIVAWGFFFGMVF